PRLWRHRWRHGPNRGNTRIIDPESQNCQFSRGLQRSSGAVAEREEVETHGVEASWNLPEVTVPGPRNGLEPSVGDQGGKLPTEAGRGQDVLAADRHQCWDANPGQPCARVVAEDGVGLTEIPVERLRVGMGEPALDDQLDELRPLGIRGRREDPWPHRP